MPGEIMHAPHDGALASQRAYAVPHIVVRDDDPGARERSRFRVRHRRSLS
jgi:hypothetical protein